MTDSATLRALPPLHPHRIAFALEVTADVYAKQMAPKDVCTETVLCVLRQTQRAQHAIGLTAEASDIGTTVTTVAHAVSKLIRKRV